MKKITLLLIFSSLSFLSSATIHFDETFNFADGTLKTASGWAELGTTSGSHTIGGTGYTYSNTGGWYALSGAGKVLTSVYANDANTLNYRLYKAFPAVNTTIYLSFLYKAGVAQGQTNSDVIGFLNGTNNGPRIWAGKGKVTASNQQVTFGVSHGGTAAANFVWEAAEHSINDIVLIVLKHDFSTNTTSLFINPTIDGTEPVTPSAVNTTTDATNRANVDGLSFRNNGSNACNFTVSGIRVSSSWSEAVASTAYTPPVSTALPAPIVGSASNVAAKSFTANWTAVSNATGYTVMVYNESTFVDSAVVAGQSTTSASITNMIPELTYTYKVKAKGDGTNFTNSVESASSQAFTLLSATIPPNNLRIILKLDDLGVLNSVLAASSAFDFMVANNIKWGSGAIAIRFDATAPGILAPYMNAVNSNNEKLMEIWHHGYDHSQNNPVGTWEFSGRSYADQKLSFENADQAIFNLLGIQMKTFGTPYNQSDATTNTVIAENQSYKVMMFSKIKSNTNGILYLDNRVNMESATGVPEFTYFKTNYLANKNTYTDYMILQGHPNYYTAGSNNLEQFKLILKYLKSEGVEFVQPYDYYKSTVISTSIENVVKNTTTDFNFSIFPNYCSNYTTLSFEGNETKELSCGIYNLTGSLVKQIFSMHLNTGSNQYIIDLSNLTSGAYICQVSDGKNFKTEKLIINKK